MKNVNGKVNEDNVFCSLVKNKPAAFIASRFAVETCFFKNPVGLHKWYNYLPSYISEDLSFIEQDSGQPYLGSDTYYEICNKHDNLIFINYDNVNYSLIIDKTKFYLSNQPAKCVIVYQSSGYANIPRAEDKLYNYLMTNDKIKMIFSKNCLLKNSKMSPLPMGLRWQRMEREYGESKAPILKCIKPFTCGPQDSLRLFNDKRSIVLLVGLSMITKSRTFQYRDLCIKNMDIVHRVNNVKQSELYQLLTRSQFVFSPPGYGIDCNRHWEALYMGAIPIMLHSTQDSMYEDLPVLIVDDYKQVNPQMLERAMFDIHKKSYNFEKLYAPYWEREFLSYL
jgi:hypothetical protein